MVEVTLIAQARLVYSDTGHLISWIRYWSRLTPEVMESNMFVKAILDICSVVPTILTIHLASRFVHQINSEKEHGGGEDRRSI